MINKKRGRPKGSISDSSLNTKLPMVRLSKESLNIYKDAAEIEKDFSTWVRKSLDIASGVLSRNRKEKLLSAFSSPLDLYQVKCEGAIGSLNDSSGVSAKMKVGDKIVFSFSQLDMDSYGYEGDQILIDSTYIETGFYTCGVLIDSIAFS